MLYGELLANAGQVLKSQANFDDLVKYVSYLQQRAKGIDIKTMPLNEVNGIVIENGKVEIKEIDKNSINKAVFEKCKKEEIEPINPTFLSEITKISQDNTKRIINEALAQANRFRSDAVRINADALSKLVAASKKTLEAMNLQNNGNDIYRPQVEKIHSESFWMFFNYTNGFISFVTRNDVILEHNETVGDSVISRKVNMGKFVLALNCNSGLSFEVKKHSGNIICSGYYHPHIDGSGNVCLGNAGPSISQAYEKLDIHHIARVVAAILTTYNPDSPYLSLNRFEDEYKGRIKELLATKDEKELMEYYTNVLSNGEELDFYDEGLNDNNIDF